MLGSLKPACCPSTMCPPPISLGSLRMKLREKPSPDGLQAGVVPGTTDTQASRFF